MQEHEIKQYHSDLLWVVTTVRKISLADSADSKVYISLRTRMYQIAAIDSFLADYRKKNSSISNRLKGKEALAHYLLIKYNISPAESKKLPLADIVLYLHSETKDISNSLLDKIKEELTSDNGNLVMAHNTFPDYLDREWDPNLFEKNFA